MTDPITSVPDAVAALGALPVPVGDQPQPWNDDRAVQVLSQAGAMCGVCGDEPGDRKCPDCESCRRDYLECLYGEAGWGPGAALLAETQRLQAELAARDERLETVRALCDAADHAGITSGGWFTVEAVRRAAAPATDCAEEAS
jgi:hypothetical protein